MKKYFLPASDKAFQLWLETFIAKLEQYLTILSIDKAEMDILKAGLARFKEAVLLTNTYKTYLKALVAYKLGLRRFPKKQASGTFPMPPVPPVAPPAFNTELNDFITKMVNRIKNNPKYTNAIGDDLDIIGADHVVDPTNKKPVLSAILSGGFVSLKYKKDGMSGADIYVCRKDDGVFVPLATVIQAKYTDPHPLPAKAEKWQYKAMYRMGDKQVGQMSEVFSITVVAG